MRIFPFPRMQSMGIVLTCLWPPFHNMNECPLILLSTNPIQWKIHAPLIRSFTSWKTVQPLVKKSWLQPYSYAVLPLPCTFDTQHLLSQHCFLSPLILFPDSALSDLSLPISCVLPIPCPHSIDCWVLRKKRTHYQICTHAKILMIVIIKKMMSKKLLRCCCSVLIYHTIY